MLKQYRLFVLSALLIAMMLNAVPASTALSNFSFAAVSSSFIRLDSEPGDWVGRGILQVFTPADGTLTVVGQRESGVVSIRFRSSIHSWGLDFAAPRGVELTPGTYEGATRWPFQDPQVPGLSVSGDGRGCNTLTGRFEVFEIVYGSTGEIERFSADFEQHCEGGPAALFGSVRFNVSINAAPECSAAVPNTDVLWPPNHNMVPISVNGVTDPDGDSITITIDSIFQDEPTNGLGDGDTSPDGQGVGTSTASVRAERAGNGNGRVYQIDFLADDGNGGTCSGIVTVGVPKSQGRNGAPVDDGPTYDSAQP